MSENNVTRRDFLASSLAFGGSMALASSLPFEARASLNRQKKNLVVVMLRGGMDGLAAIPPLKEKELRQNRKDIWIDDLSPLTKDFGLHPRLKTFGKFWQEDRAAVVHATSIPYTGRSHFEGQNLTESGGTKPYFDKTGWLGRAMELDPAVKTEGLSISLPMPLLLRGKGVNDNFFPSHNDLPNEGVMELLARSYKNDPALSAAMERVRSRPLFMSEFKSRDDDFYQLGLIAGKRLRDPLGPNIAVFDIVGFDTHAAQGDESGDLSRRLKDYDNLLKSLRKTMGDAMDNTLIVTLTEFGRTMAQNGGSGTEHGYGSAIMLAGGLVKKSQVWTEWPGLGKSDLFEGRDLDVTLNAHAVYASALSCCFEMDFDQISQTSFFSNDLPDMISILFKI